MVMTVRSTAGRNIESQISETKMLGRRVAAFSRSIGAGFQGLSHE
jgi:hypothetical protein